MTIGDMYLSCMSMASETFKLGGTPQMSLTVNWHGFHAEGEMICAVKICGGEGGQDIIDEGM